MSLVMIGETSRAMPGVGSDCISTGLSISATRWRSCISTGRLSTLRRKFSIFFPVGDELRLHGTVEDLQAFVLNDDRFVGQTRHFADQFRHALIARRNLRQLAVNLRAAPLDLAFVIDQQADDGFFDHTNAAARWASARTGMP